MVPAHYLYLHCFQKTIKDARIWLQSWPNVFFGLGSKILTGLHDSVIQELPLAHILFESDAPFLMEHPRMLEEVIKHIALVRNLALLIVRYVAVRNAVKFYNSWMG